MDDIESRPAEGVNDDVPKLSSMPQLARVVSHYDPTFNGRLQVEILRQVGGDRTDGEVQTVDMITPFYSATSTEYIAGAADDEGVTEDSYNNTQKAAGMWFVPPDVGTTVMVLFINGDPKRGYWFGCVPDTNANFSLPGYPATKFVTSDSRETDTAAERVPVAEYNKEATATPISDTTKINKPEHPFAKVLEKQGLLQDDIRGITTSGARREAPSMVFGISTPGPIDRQSGAPRGKKGTKETLVENAFISRLGGSSFVMDDGDDKFIRKTPAGEGPPEYAALEQDDDMPDDPTLVHNELIRIRTRTGHQILLHNSEDLIYITNARGTSWIEMTSNGKIDIYANDSISVHSENDINFTAGRDINLTAAANINLNSGTNINQQTGADWSAKVGGTAKINPGGDFQVLASNTAIDGGNINLNSGVATAATAAPKASRVPMTEPWAGHENLDPTSHSADKTKASEAGPTATEPEYFKKYTTTTDTFAMELPPGQESDESEDEESGE